MISSRLVYTILIAILLLAISYATAQPLQGHPWTEITLPPGNNIWTNLNADKLDGMHFSNFSGRLWSGYDPATSNIWYSDGGNVGIGTDSPSAKLDIEKGRIQFRMYETGPNRGATLSRGDLLVTESDESNFDEEMILSFVNGDDRSKIFIGPNEVGGGVGEIELDSKNIFIDHANVGIGTHTPSERLTVSGNIRILNSQLQITRPSGAGGYARGMHFRSSDGSFLEAGIGMHGSGNSPPDSLYMAFGSNPWSSGTGIYLKSDGNVGIGIVNPSEKLDVSGNVEASGDVTANRLCIGTSCISSWSDVRDTDWTESGGNVYRSSGNVGIGTSSPSQKLEVSGGSLYVHGSSGGQGRVIMGINGGHQWEWYPTTSAMGLYDRTSGAYRIYVTNNGDVRMGTSSSNYRNVYARDYYIASSGKWASSLGGSPRFTWYHIPCDNSHNKDLGVHNACFLTHCSGHGNDVEWFYCSVWPSGYNSNGKTWTGKPHWYARAYSDDKCWNAGPLSSRADVVCMDW